MNKDKPSWKRYISPLIGLVLYFVGSHMYTRYQNTKYEHSIELRYSEIFLLVEKKYNENANSGMDYKFSEELKKHILSKGYTELLEIYISSKPQHWNQIYHKDDFNFTSAAGNGENTYSKVSQWVCNEASGEKYDVIKYTDIIHVKNRDVKIRINVDKDLM